MTLYAGPDASKGLKSNYTALHSSLLIGKIWKNFLILTLATTSKFSYLNFLLLLLLFKPPEYRKMLDYSCERERKLLAQCQLLIPRRNRYNEYIYNKCSKITVYFRKTIYPFLLLFLTNIFENANKSIFITQNVYTGEEKFVPARPCLWRACMDYSVLRNTFG